MSGQEEDGAQVKDGLVRLGMVEAGGKWGKLGKTEEKHTQHAPTRHETSSWRQDRCRT